MPEEEASPPSAPNSPKDLSNKVSWASVVTNKKNLIKHDFQVIDGSAMVVVPEDVLGDTPLWDDFLVGRFLSSAPDVAKIHVIVNKIWLLGEKKIRVYVFAVTDKTVKFRIRDPAVLSRALRRGM